MFVYELTEKYTKYQATLVNKVYFQRKTHLCWRFVSLEDWKYFQEKTKVTWIANMVLIIRAAKQVVTVSSKCNLRGA